MYNTQIQLQAGYDYGNMIVTKQNEIYQGTGSVLDTDQAPLTIKAKSDNFGNDDAEALEADELLERVRLRSNMRESIIDLSGLLEFMEGEGKAETELQIADYAGLVDLV